MATGEKKAGGTAAAGEGRRGGCRQGGCRRQTRETDITLTLALDGSGQVGVETGIGFFDHMLTAFAVHGGLDLTLRAKGDLAVDGHHTVEDCGIAIGVALREALGDKSGISRFGSALLPMDDALAQVALDIGGRSYLRFAAEFTNEQIGAYDTCLTKEFFRALTDQAGITLHISLLYSDNDHHGCEAIFKAFGRALAQGAARSGREGPLSAKGVLA